MVLCTFAFIVHVDARNFLPDCSNSQVVDSIMPRPGACCFAKNIQTKLDLDHVSQICQLFLTFMCCTIGKRRRNVIEFVVAHVCYKLWRRKYLQPCFRFFRRIFEEEQALSALSVKVDLSAISKPSH